LGKYGKCAKAAVDLLKSNKAADPIVAWKKAALETFPDSESSRKKCCPKNAFLGLCEEGLIRGVSAGGYTESKDNKRYALNAVSLLKKNPNLSKNENVLWEKIQGNNAKKHNAQMDVVITLWDNDLIV
jgi:uncharacterized protein YegP (UPF0339 family)